MVNYPQSPGIRHLFSRGQPLVFNKGDVILGNGPEPDGVYYVSSGYVKIYSISDQGDEYLHIIYGVGEIFPLVWAYLGVEPEGLFYEALSDCAVWRLSRDWFVHYITSDLKIATHMSSQLAQQFRVYIDRIDNLEYKKANERIAYLLLFLAGRFGVRDRDRISIEAPITHEVFANSINLARESVSRELERLERENIIERDKRQLVIIDLAGLLAQLSHPISLANWQL